MIKKGDMILDNDPRLNVAPGVPRNGTVRDVSIGGERVEVEWCTGRVTTIKASKIREHDTSKPTPRTGYTVQRSMAKKKPPTNRSRSR